MIHHLSLPVTDIKRSAAFYATALLRATAEGKQELL
ncbi:MAG: VOC family protein [Opitutaceae bacterium]|nr:VOC family protein [Opitutaceae bacterium]